MIIANPIYDVVFKYLLEDIEIARGLLSTIIGEEIVTLTLQPQELSVRKIQTQEVIRIIRLDFKAVVKTKTGDKKMILIELQKARKLFDIMRFRHYLGENYKKGEEILSNKGETETKPIPIITIYFLGFKLEKIEVAVIKVNRVYTDVNTGEALSKDTKEPFIENLTHDCYVIQIPFLGENKRTNLEKVLRVFNQKFKIRGDRHRLDFGESTDEPLVQKIIDRLNRAIASDEILAEMDAEDEVERLFGKIEKQLEEAEKQLEESEKNNLAKDKKLKENTAKLKENTAKLEEKDSEIEILRKELEALKKNKK